MSKIINLFSLFDNSILKKKHNIVQSFKNASSLAYYLFIYNVFVGLWQVSGKTVWKKSVKTVFSSTLFCI